MRYESSTTAGSASTRAQKSRTSWRDTEIRRKARGGSSIAVCTDVETAKVDANNSSIELLRDTARSVRYKYPCLGS